MHEASELVGLLRNKSQDEIARLMDISPALAELNAARFAHWSMQPQAFKPAVLAFNGDVYEGLQATGLDEGGLDYLQRHVRILSGLYGLLRPLDQLQAYRLEMGTRLENARGKNLYAFWGERVGETLRQQLHQQKSEVLVNLASEEYFKVIRPGALGVDVVTPVFLDWKNGVYKTISFFAKRARGLMVRYCADRKLTQAESLKQFTAEGYAYCAAESDVHKWVFKRRN